jgi:hypothetical protein
LAPTTSAHPLTPAISCSLHPADSHSCSVSKTQLLELIYLANLRKNATAEVKVVDPLVRKGYRFIGSATSSPFELKKHITISPSWMAWAVGG